MERLGLYTTRTNPILIISSFSWKIAMMSKKVDEMS